MNVYATDPFQGRQISTGLTVTLPARENMHCVPHVGQKKARSDKIWLVAEWSG